MNNKIENKRASERFLLEGPIKYSYTTSKDIFEGKIINCSEGGINFETTFEIKPGTVIFIADVEDNKYFRAEVKWCKNLNSANSNLFSVGAKYLDSA